jgi:hypothetical protein
VTIRLETLSSPIVAAVEKLPFVQSFSHDENQLTTELDAPERNLPELIKCVVEAGGRIMEVSEKQHSLEDVYLTLVREGENIGS